MPDKPRTDTERMDWLEAEAPDIERDYLGNAVVTFNNPLGATNLDSVEECTLREAVDAAMEAQEKGGADDA